MTKKVNIEAEAAHLRQIVIQEGERLRRQSQRLEQKLHKLCKRYPTGQKLAAEVQTVQSANADFLSSLEVIDWKEVVAEVSSQLIDVMSDSDVVDGEPIVLQWDHERGGFVSESKGPRWRHSSAWCVGVGKRVEKALKLEAVSQGSKNGEGVTYPILFTHQLKANHRAVVRAIEWGAVALCVRRYLRCGDDSSVVVLGRDGDELCIRADSENLEQRRPTAKAFGFREGGELLRRIEDFDQVDAQAHWIWWTNKRRRADGERYVLREKSGTRVELEVRRGLRRLRLVERSATEVVRKRRHVFAEPGRSQTEDRFFATEEKLDAVLEKEVERRIDAGYRIVEQSFEKGGDLSRF